jgi:hypothetical protein
MSVAMEDPTEAAVRNYLLFLEDPSKLIDQAHVEELRRRAAEATDPIDRLKAYAALERAEKADDTKFKLDFISHAKTWAQAHGVGASVFRQLGVKDEVLRSAGLLPASRGRKAALAVTPPNRSSVTAEAIKQHVLSRRGTFLLADLVADVGGSPMTVRKAVQELIATGAIRRLGPVSDRSRRGRAPVLFEVCNSH